MEANCHFSSTKGGQYKEFYVTSRKDCSNLKWRKYAVESRQQLPSGAKETFSLLCPLPQLTSDLLLQTEDDCHSLVKDQKLGLGLFALQVELAHPAQFLEGFVDVPDTQALPGIVSHPPFPLTLQLLLRVQLLIFVRATFETKTGKVLKVNFILPHCTDYRLAYNRLDFLKKRLQQ